jgi:hypothetical protein
MKRDRGTPTAPRGNWTGDGLRYKHDALPGKPVCGHHEWVIGQDPAWINFLEHLGRLVAREYVAEQMQERTGLTRETLLRLLR